MAAIYQRTLIENTNVRFEEGDPSPFIPGLCGGWGEWGPVSDDHKELTEMVCI